MTADLEGAREWFKRAAEARSRRSSSLGGMPVNGRGGSAALAAGKSCVSSPQPQGMTAEFLQRGRCTAATTSAGRSQLPQESWFRAASELGHGQAQVMLGRYLGNGAAGHRGIEGANAELAEA